MMALKTILSNFLNLLENNNCLKNLGKDVYDLEFQQLKALTDKLKQDPEFSCKHGAQEINRCKNRYKDILPYDITRVILTEDSEIPGSDYINANYIKGASNSLEYIASQGPLPNTVVDFWRMIWECEVKVIIMACNERESGKQKCECYWSEEEKKSYGYVTVEVLKIQYICPDFLVRTFKAINNNSNKERIIYQFHYTTWPDHGVPVSVEPILQLIQLVRKFQASEAVPILVHCSAGCGRTGTICSIDYVWRLMKMGKLTEFFNLYEIISKMRKQRIAMVQTKEQYILVHRAVAALFEHQLELIDNHIYENLDENGHPLLKDTEILNSHEVMNEENENSFEMKKQDYPMDFKKETIESSLGEESDATITNDDLENTNYESFDVGNETANNINYSINDYNCDQNVNFTISLPLNPSKSFTDNLSVSTTITYNDDKIFVDSKKNKNTSSNINECGYHAIETN
ncbi:tyrosine-protein phosphatase non-receptor type 12-like [Centruroides vittatus]|uniref:tyrosine-protein phosphatase non-receptor type 12-like n=1 Tax=Centruroides vittatus TaxID=120091 RepID=UPI00350FAC65